MPGLALASTGQQASLVVSPTRSGSCPPARPCRAGTQTQQQRLAHSLQRRQQHKGAAGRRHHLQTCTALADVELAPPNTVDIQGLVYADGCYTVQGRLVTAASADAVYEVLVDYEALPRVFHNVESSSVRHCSQTGQKQLVQTCKWAFLVFSGTFVNELNVVEDPARRSLTFSLVESAFMRQFVGSWELEPLPDGLTEVRHRLSVTPVVSPPQKIGDISKKIFRSQVAGILEDLNAELQRRLG